MQSDTRKRLAWDPPLTVGRHHGRTGFLPTLSLALPWCAVLDASGFAPSSFCTQAFLFSLENVYRKFFQRSTSYGHHAKRSTSHSLAKTFTNLMVKNKSVRLWLPRHPAQTRWPSAPWPVASSAPHSTSLFGSLWPSAQGVVNGGREKHLL